VFGAADVRIAFINSHRGYATSGYFPAMTLGRAELSVAAGDANAAAREMAEHIAAALAVVLEDVFTDAAGERG